MSLFLPTQSPLQTNLAINSLHPLPVRPRGRISPKQHIHLLERQSLRLRHIEPDERRAHERKQSENDVRSVRDAAEHVRRHLADDEVVHPVRGGAESDAVGAVGHGPDFGDEDPGAGTCD